MRWNRGILPVAAALAVILAIFAAIAAPDWFARSKDGLDSPALPEDLLGLLTLIVVPVQLILIVVAMIGFNQEWHVEEERPIGGQPLHGEGDDAPAPPRPPPEPAGAQNSAPCSSRGSISSGPSLRTSLTRSETSRATSVSSGAGASSSSSSSARALGIEPGAPRRRGRARPASGRGSGASARSAGR